MTDYFIFTSSVPFTSNDPTVLMGDANVRARYYTDTVGLLQSYSINGMGRYVRIQLYGSNALNLAEVRVLGATGGIYAYDDCDNNVEVSFSEVQSGGGCSFDVFRTWIATDDCGLTASGSQIITITDSDPPVFVAPADLTVSCDSIPTPVPPVATDSCGTLANAVTVVLTNTATAGSGCSYMLTYTWTATDECGNAASTTQDITVIDDSRPYIGSAYYLDTLGFNPAASSYTLANGTLVMRGTFTTADNAFKTVSFPTNFTTTPIVFVQVVTTNGASALGPRIRNVSTTDFQVRLRREQLRYKCSNRRNDTLDCF